ncbi:hypothetical protein VE03_01139 [Pseudogymnoascus sp. 23342-1-I1]|nr:hypothetical protein VE03_01139 [Pseudogymnoascus sp. 23342-1-I1]
MPLKGLKNTTTSPPPAALFSDSTSRLVLRRPTTSHEEFITSIVEEIQVQLKSLQTAFAAFAREIRSSGSASINFADEEYGKHDPDALFRHSKAQFPGVVIEVSYSQKRKDLARLADDYILGSDSDIRVVVFRDANGDLSASSTGGLRLRLRDFATEALAGDEPQLCDAIVVPTSTVFVSRAGGGCGVRRGAADGCCYG